MENTKIQVEGKGELDYEEFSNLNKKDLVPIFKTADQLIALCKEYKIPLIISFVTDTNPVFSGMYDPNWDDEKLTKLSVLIGNIKLHLRERFGAVMEWKGWIKPKN